MNELRQRHYDDGRAPEPVYDDRPRTVSLAEQKETGMVKRSNYVKAERGLKSNGTKSYAKPSIVGNFNDF